MQILVDDLTFVIGLDVTGGDFALTGLVNINGLHAVTVHLCDDSLNVQNDLGNVFLNAGDSGDLVENSIYLNALDRYTDNILEMQEDAQKYEFEEIEIKSMDYNLKEMLDKTNQN